MWSCNMFDIMTNTHLGFRNSTERVTVDGLALMVANRFDELEGDINSRFNNVDSRINDLDRKIGNVAVGLGKKIDGVENRLTDKFDKLSGEFSVLSNQFRSLSEEVCVGFKSLQNKI